MNPTLLRVSLTLTTGTLVGAGFVVAKMLLAAGADQSALAFFQVSAAAALIAIGMRYRRASVPTDRATLVYLMGAALIGIAAGPLLGNWVLARIPAGVFTVLVTLSPMFTTLFNSILDRRWPSVHTASGIALGLLGVLLVLVPRAQTVGAEQSLALMMALGVPLLLAAGNVYRSRQWPEGLSPAIAPAGTLMMQTAVLTPVFLMLPYESVASVPRLWPLVLVLVAVTVTSQLAGSFLQRVAGAAAFSQIGYVVALTGIGASALLFGESLGTLFWPAVLLVFAGIILTNRATGAVRKAVDAEVRARGRPEDQVIADIAAKQA